MGGFSFPKSARILRSSDFRRIYDNGIRHTCPLFSAFFVREDSREGGPRVGFTVGRAAGNAVVRNRLKRRMREAVRVRLPLLTGPWAIVFNPRRAALEAPFELLGREVDRLWERCRNS